MQSQKTKQKDMAKNKQFTINNLTIDSAGNDGRCVGRADDMVVFVDHVVPGDVVDAFVYRKKRRFAEARAIHFHKYSEFRVEAQCQHFGLCGGCKWQNLDYTKQVEFKRNHVIDCLTRLCKIELPEVLPCIGSDHQFYYRNKMEYTFSTRRWIMNPEDKTENGEVDTLGFHMPGRYDKILQIENCHLQAPLHNEIRNYIYEYAIQHGLQFYDLRKQEGLLRSIIIRNTTQGEWMLIFTFHRMEENVIFPLMKDVEAKFPQITTIDYVINQKLNNVISDLDAVNFKGPGYMVEHMDNLQFRINPKAFYQTNPAQAKVLYSVARDFAQLTGNELVYDLYTGTGTIALFLANMAKKVIGVEYVKEAIDDAKINSEINQIYNTEFFAGDMKDVLNDEFIAAHGKPDVVITDPPRTGMHPDVVKMIVGLGAKRVVYVSCNPATQARDLSILDEKYKVMKIQPVDMFPQTNHVENVVLLELK